MLVREVWDISRREKCFSWKGKEMVKELEVFISLVIRDGGVRS